MQYENLTAAINKYLEHFDKTANNNFKNQLNLTPVQVDNLNTSKQELIKELDLELKKAGMSNIEIVNYKALTGLDKIAKHTFTKDGLTSPAELIEFNDLLKSKLASQTTDPVNVNNADILNLQRIKDFADYLTINSDKLNSNKSLKNYYDSLEVDLEKIAVIKNLINDKKLQDKAIQEYFNELALKKFSNENNYFTDLANTDKNGFGQYVKEQDQKYTDQHKHLFTTETVKQQKEIGQHGRALNDAGGLTLKQSLFVAKMAYHAVLPHTILTALAFKAIHKSGAFEVAGKYLKEKLTTLKENPSMKSNVLKALIYGTLAVGSIVVLAGCADNPAEAKEIFSNLGNTLTDKVSGVDYQGYTQAAIDKVSQAKELTGNTITELTETVKEKFASTPTPETVKPHPFDSMTVNTDHPKVKEFSETVLSKLDALEAKNAAAQALPTPEPTVDYITGIEQAAAKLQALEAAQQAAEQSIQQPVAEPIQAQVETVKPEATAQAITTTPDLQQHIGRPLPIGNIYNSGGAMDLVKEINGGIDLNQVKAGTEIKLPTFGIDGQGNRVITGFTETTVQKGDTVSEMFVSHATTQPMPITAEHKALLENSLNLNLEAKTATVINEQGIAETTHANNDGVIKVHNEVIQEAIAKEMVKTQVLFQVVDPETGMLIESKNSTLGKLGFVSTGVNADNLKVASINSPEIMEKVMAGQPITPAEYEEVKQNAKEFKQENSHGRRFGYR